MKHSVIGMITFNGELNMSFMSELNIDQMNKEAEPKRNHTCEYCGKKYRNRYDRNVIITDDDIHETCSQECHYWLGESFKHDG